jgi:hypothetical protein
VKRPLEAVLERTHEDHANLLPAHRPFYTEDYGGCHPGFSIMMPVADYLSLLSGPATTIHELPSSVHMSLFYRR